MTSRTRRSASSTYTSASKGAKSNQRRSGVARPRWTRLMTPSTWGFDDGNICQRFPRALKLKDAMASYCEFSNASVGSLVRQPAGEHAKVPVVPYRSSLSWERVGLRAASTRRSLKRSRRWMAEAPETYVQIAATWGALGGCTSAERRPVRLAQLADECRISKVYEHPSPERP